MAPPTRLYKYQPFSAQSIANLKCRQLWFSRPSRFNDPFDCRIRIDDKITDADFDRVFEYLHTRRRNPAALEAQFRMDSQLSAEFRAQVEHGLIRAFEERVRTNFNDRGICCLTERVDDLLMWSHYGDGHRGYCLEFDTRLDPFHRALPVNYSAAFPKISPAAALVEPRDADFLSMITTKSSCWSYEREWRMLHAEADKAYVYPWQALTAVYFGAAMEFSHIEIIALILRGSPTKLVQADRSEHEFSLAFREVTYSPFEYRNPEA